MFVCLYIYIFLARVEDALFFFLYHSTRVYRICGTRVSIQKCKVSDDNFFSLTERETKMRELDDTNIDLILQVKLILLSLFLSYSIVIEAAA
jgi:hypothetical protein